MHRERRESFPRHRLQRKPLVSDSGMHHGTCVTHLPWYMSGSLTRGGAENVPGIPGACATRNFTYLVRGPFDRWPRKTIGNLFHVHRSYVCHFIAIHEFKLELLFGNVQIGATSSILRPCDLQIWWLTSKNYRAPLLCHFKLCASYGSHR